MAYAILRFAKHKGGASKALSAHHERTKDSYASNPDIDLSRTAQNFHLVTPRWSYEQEIKHRIQTAGCRVRKDSVKFVDTLVTVSPEFAKAHEVEMPEYFRRAFDFLKERVGEENIFSAVVHMDEKTPHMHLCFVPLTRDKRLSAKEILGNKKSMIRWQDDFYACMAERWPELERGTPAVETKRRHLTPQWYKKVTAMDAKLEQLEATLNNINVFNAGKKREEAVPLLAQLLPEVESFQAETQRLRDTIAHERRNASFQREINADLRNELKAERSHSFDQSIKLSELERRYKRAERLLSKIPQEELDRFLPMKLGLDGYYGGGAALLLHGGPVWRSPSFVIHHISSLCNQNNSSKAEHPSSISVCDQLSIRCHHDLPYRFKIVHMNAFVGMIPNCQVNGSPAGRTEFC